MSKINVLRNLGILIGTAASLAACTPEEYGPCSIPNTKAHTVACSPMGGSKTATCAVDYVFDCDSLICGIYESSDAFCTHRCLPKTNECTSSKGCSKAELDEAGLKYKIDCPENGHCVEFIRGTSAYYCMSDELYKKYGVANKVKPASSEPTPTPTKKENGADCSSNTDCKSSYCNEDKVCADKPAASTLKDNGEDCEAGTECKSGYCSDDKKCDVKPADPVLKPDGEACTDNSECANGFCNEEKQCATKPADEACKGKEPNVPCGEGMVCDENEACVDAPATEKKGNGEACTVDSDCTSEFCNPEGNVCADKPAEKKGNGEACTADSDCTSEFCNPEGNVCADKPAEKLPEGSACTENDQCESGNCTGEEGSKVCAAAAEKLPEGTACTENDQCASGNCAGEEGSKVCAAAAEKLPNDSDCTANEQCQSNYCDTGTSKCADQA